jgi:hypothetical protein
MASSVFFGASSEDIWGSQQRDATDSSPAQFVRRCSRPTCSATARFTMAFDYAQQRAVLTPLIADLTPELYDLCDVHADRTSPPRGWSLADDRYTAATQGRIFTDEAQALSALIDDMKRTPRKAR